MVIPLTYGRLGNFLFQAAATMAYAWDWRLAYTVPSKSALGRDPKMNPVYLPHLRNPKWDSSLPSVNLREKQFHFVELAFCEEWRPMNIVLDGYWQSEKYFKHHRLRLLHELGFEWKCLTGVVSVHVRRGDYLRWTRKHPPVPVAWIKSAMDQFKGYHFHFFSDDIQWCQQTFGEHSWITYSVGNTETADLVAMSWCEHHICSASTFSWWGAWLNQNPDKRVVIPKLWFVPGWGGHDTKDVIPKEWTLL